MNRDRGAAYSSMTDEALIEAVRAGDISAEERLYERYKQFIKSRAHSYFLTGADREDIMQEGMIGLYKAIRDYDATKTNTENANSFKSFAELCVTRQILTAIKKATRQKHIPLNTYVSLNKPLSYEDTERTLIDVLSAAHVSDPEETVISRETYAAVAKHLRGELSVLERDTLALYLDGRSYVEIAAALNRQPKAIDNAIQRVKHKLESLMEESS